MYHILFYYANKRGIPLFPWGKRSLPVNKQGEYIIPLHPFRDESGLLVTGRNKSYTFSMGVTEQKAKTILHKMKKIDSWFLSHYSMNLYRGCLHNCAYCDGRDEKYRVEGCFHKDIRVKINAPEILSRELDPARKRKPMAKGFILVGGGVNDSYQPLEKKYRLTRQALEFCLQYGHPVHILTKSTLVLEDIELITAINRQNRAILSFSFSSAGEKLSSHFEPGVPSPLARLEALAEFKKRGIPCGMYLMPVLPGLSDTPRAINAALKAATEYQLDFVIPGSLTLKPGRQAEHFYPVLSRFAPRLVSYYNELFPPTPYGMPGQAYLADLYALFARALAYYKMPCRIPARLYRSLLDNKSLAIVILEHLDFMYRLEGRKSSFGYAAHKIASLKPPLSEWESSLRKLPGMDAECGEIIREILSGTEVTALKKYNLA